MQEGNKPPAGGQWQYRPEDNQPAAQHSVAPSDYQVAPNASHAKTVEWTASEYIAHHKSTGWYAALFIGAGLVTVLVYLLTHDRITAVVFVIVALVFAFAAGRKPRVLTYRLDTDGLTVGNHLYPYGDYQAFSLVDEGHFTSVFLLPYKRFMPGLTLYFAPEDEERILSMLSANLPLRPENSHLIDHIMRRVRF